MSLGKRLERMGGILILLGFVCILPLFPVAYFDLMDPQDALLLFGFGGALVAAFGFLSAVIGVGLGMDEGGVSSIPDEELTPEQQLRKREIALQEQQQRQEGVEKAAELFFGGGSGETGGGGSVGGSAGTKNERDAFSLTDHVRQKKNKYSGKYVRSPKCPNCGSQATAPTGDDENVFQCDKCGDIFETRAQTRRDVNLNIED